MNRKTLRWQLWLFLFVQNTQSSAGCTWKDKTVRILGVFDGYDANVIETLNTVTADRNYEALHDEKTCIPKIQYNILYFNDSFNELDVIQAVQDRFKYHSYCAIFFASRDRKGSYVLEYAATSKIPVIDIRTKRNRNQTDTLPNVWEGVRSLQLNQQTSLQDKITSMAPILKFLGWRKMVIIYDNAVESLRIASSLERTMAANRIVKINSTTVTRETSLYSLATTINMLRIDCSSFVILTDNPQIISLIFRAAQPFGMLGPANMWILFTNLQSDSVPTYLLPFELFIVYPSLAMWTPQQLVHDAVSLVTNGLRIMSTAKKKYKGMCSCRCECQAFTESFYRSMLQSQFTGKTGLVAYDDEGKRTNVQFNIEIISEPDGQVNRDLLGFWDGTSVTILLQRPRPKLRVLINEYPPNIMSVPKTKNNPCPAGASLCTRTVESSDGSEEQIERCCYGFAIDVLHLLKGTMGFEPELRFSEDGQFGVYDDKNDSWNGIVRELLDGKGDVTLDLYISARRATVLDFTEPYVPSGIRLLVKERSGKGNNIYWLSYLRPFTKTVWMTLLGSMGVMIVFLWFVEKFAPCRHPNKVQEDTEDEDENSRDQYILELEERGFCFEKPDGEKEKLQCNVLEKEDPKQLQPLTFTAFGLDNAVCFTLALAFGRPADEAKPMLNGARLASVAFGLAMLMLMSSYSANLAAFLIVEDKYTSVTSIYDEKIMNPPSGFKYGTVTGSYMADFFANAESAYMRSMWYHMRGNNVGSLSEGVDKVKSGELDVFIADHISLEYESLNDQDCELKVVGEPFAMSGASVAVKKGSPWFNTLNDALQQLKSKDLTDFIQKFWVSKYRCSNEKPPSQLQIQDLSGLFLQLLIAIVACFIGTFVYNAVGALPHLCKRRNSKDEEHSVIKPRVSAFSCKFRRMSGIETHV